MRWTVVQAAEALGIPGPQGLDSLAELVGVSIDSRTIEPQELFVAIHGPRHDGHGFVAVALERGGRAAVVDRKHLMEYPPEIRGRLFAVDNTLDALHRLASRACEIWRKQKPGRRIVGVAGSVGKTTTKEILAALLSAQFRVLKTQGNLNNEYGLPLTLLKLGPEYDTAVVELGMSRRGELAGLTQIASPEVGLITRVAVEHLEFFSSIDEIALAERELIENLVWPDATAVLNADDDRVAKFAGVARGPVIWFGTGQGVDFRAEAIEERGIEGSAFDFIWPAGRARLEIPLIGRHNVMNALAALAAASVWGIGAEEAKSVFPKLRPADKRGEIVHFEMGFTIINDSYNSSPTALQALADLLASTPGYQRRILVAGEMRELGTSSAELHRECGQMAANLKEIDWIFGVQGHAADLVRGAVVAGYREDHTQYFESSAEAARFLETFVAPGDLLLVKGSRGVRMEKILEVLEAQHRRANKTSASEILEVGRKGRS